MRRAAAALVVVAMMGGCVSYGASKTTAKVGAGFMIAGLAVALAILVADQEPGRGSLASTPGQEAAMAGLALGIPGVLVALGGLIGMGVHESPPPALPQTTPPALDEREQAFALTRAAAQAARSGDCTLAIEMERRVRELDAIVHEEWFVRDPAIKGCLDPAPVVPPAGAADVGIVDPFEAPPGEPSRAAPPASQP